MSLILLKKPETARSMPSILRLMFSMVFAVMGKDAPAPRADFRRTDRVRNGLLKHPDFAAVHLPNQCIDFPAVIGAAVRHGHQDTLDFQLRVDLPAHFLDGLQQLLQSLCRKVLRLHRNQCGIRSRSILRFEEQVSTRRSTI